MNCSENERMRKEIRRKNRRKELVAWLIVLSILFSTMIVLISGLVHMFHCTKMPNVVKAENVVTVEETKPTLTSIGTYELTAYCACKKCCGKTDGITASGVIAVEGVTIAADTKIHPFGTNIIIDGHEYTVQDRGGAIKGNKIDIYFENHQKALEFGVQYKDIYVKGGEIT